MERLFEARLLRTHRRGCHRQTTRVWSVFDEICPSPATLFGTGDLLVAEYSGFDERRSRRDATTPTSPMIAVWGTRFAEHSQVSKARVPRSSVEHLLHLSGSQACP